VIWASRCATRCLASVKTCVTTMLHGCDGAIGAKGITFNDKSRGLGLVGQALRYAFFQDGMLGSAAAHSIERMIILSLTAQSRQTSQCIFRLQQRLSSDGSLFR
jgi:hypothetical protein